MSTTKADDLVAFLVAFCSLRSQPLPLPSADASCYETIRKFLPITLNYGFLFVQNQPIFFGFYRISLCSTSSVLNSLDVGMDAHVAKPLVIAPSGKVAPQGRKGVVSHKLPFVGNRPTLHLLRAELP